jgi:hypothetical protein
MKFAFRVIFTRPPFSKWLPTKSSNCQWSLISMKIDIYLKFDDFVGGHFDNKNDPECKFHHYQPIPHFKIT